MPKAAKIQNLKLTTVKRKAREAYEARTLTAQQRDPYKRICVYEDGKHHCAIGASLTKATLAPINESGCNGNSVHALIERGLITVYSADVGAIADIQRAHDDWAIASRLGGGKSPAAIRSHKLFLDTIYA